ncbi:MAG TPA: tetratricopeptide repeat protein [Bryobacteraceae bacterium]|nr:tetratricopeptide repeat protein [Bryobacteraceae bacterium]
MFARLRIQGLILAGFAFAACSAWAQTGGIEGKVVGDDGQPVKGAVIHFQREDIKGNYKCNTDKHGHYVYTGLPLGTYKVSVEVEGRERDSMDKVRNHFGGDAAVVDFDLHKKAQETAALNQAAQSGQLTKEQERSLSAEQKAAIESQMKEIQKLATKNKALNEAFNGGRTALAAKQYDEAITQFNKAAEIDPNQLAIWSNLAEAYIGLADSKTDAAEKQATYEKGFEAYQKAIAINPTDGALHNNYALALVKVKKIDEAQAELQKAAELDPPSAPKAYYNMGAVLTNIGQSEAAGAAFKKAIDTDPTYAEAQYQYAIYLSGKMPPPGPDGKITAPPGMAEALNKYLELAPNGPNAESAKGLLALLSTSVQTTYTNPNAEKKKAPPSKKK